MYEQQGFQPPSGLCKPALRNQAALNTLLNHHMAQQEAQAGALPATELIAAADELTDLAPHAAKVDLLRHSHALHQEDYLAAVDSLYKYFDYSTGTLGCLLHICPVPRACQPVCLCIILSCIALLTQAVCRGL